MVEGGKPTLAASRRTDDAHGPTCPQGGGQIHVGFPDSHVRHVHGTRITPFLFPLLESAEQLPGRLNLIREQLRFHAVGQFRVNQFGGRQHHGRLDRRTGFVVGGQNVGAGRREGEGRFRSGEPLVEAPNPVLFCHGKPPGQPRPLVFLPVGKDGAFPVQGDFDVPEPRQSLRGVFSPKARDFNAIVAGGRRRVTNEGENGGHTVRFLSNPLRSSRRSLGGPW